MADLAGVPSTGEEIEADHLREQLVGQLISDQAVDPDWASTLRAVPRHAFIPDTIWRVDPDAEGRLVPLRRSQDPQRWLRLTYADAPVSTQVDDGHPAADGTGWEVTSSASQPSVVTDMLTVLDLEPGMRVLEIGTGTGWNAALLAHRVGASNVTSIEIDPHIATQARAALDRLGYDDVTVITGDGALGWAPNSSYDRVIATAAVEEVPTTWVTQTRPGGRMVVPLTDTYQPPGLAILDVTTGPDDQLVAIGRLGGEASFMALRAQRRPRPRGVHLGGDIEHRSETDLHPYRWAGRRDAATAIGQRLRTLGRTGIHTLFEPIDALTGVQWLFDPDSRSFAAVHLDQDGGPYVVEQGGGSRRLFDEVADAYRWWLDVGSPPLTSWEIRVLEGQSIELNTTYRACDRSPSV